MNKTFNINLGSYPFAIDEDAYEYIQNYLDTIRRHFPLQMAAKRYYMTSKYVWLNFFRST